jgi:hypothetical protein
MKGLVKIPRHRLEGNITMDVREMGREGGDWIQLAQAGV